MKLEILKASTSVTVKVFIQSSITGGALIGLVYNSSGLTAYYIKPGDASTTAISLATATLGTWATGGFIVVDATNMPGTYELSLPNAVLTTANSVLVYLQGAANMAPCILEIQLVSYDPNDAVHLGLSSLPNTAVTGNASLLTSGTGTDQLSVSSGRIDIGKAMGTAVTLDTNNVLNVSAKYLAGTALTGRDIGASVLLSAGTGTGQLDFTSGVVKANATQWLGGTIPAVNVTGVPLVDAKYLLGTIFATPATAGVLDVNAKNINNVSASSVTTINANVGTTQPINFTGTGASALAKSDMVDIAGAAVDTTLAQIGVNLVKTRGTASAGAAGYIGIDWGNINAPTTTVNLSGTTVGTITAYTGNTVQTGDVYALANGASGFVAIKVNTASIVAKLPANAIADETLVIAATNAIITAVGSPVQTTSAPSWYTAPVDVSANVAAIKAKTDNLPASPAATGAQMALTAQAILDTADGLLKRDWTAVSGEAARSVLNALRKLRNKIDTTTHGGNLTVFKEDDLAEAYQQVIVVSASAELITSAG